jgi:hypothetical protein
MVRTTNIGWSVLVTLALAAGRAGAETEVAGAPGEWLSRYSSARTLAMGGAFVACADDALGALWNPAGLSFMNQDALCFENARLFGESSINALGFAVPGSWLPSFGASMVTLGSGEFEKTNEMNDVLGTFKETETAYLFTLAKHLSTRMSVGANAKLVQQSVEDFSAQGFGFDLGALVYVTPDLRIGASVANIGGPELQLRDAAETYPMDARLGVTAAVFGGRGLMNAQVDRSKEAGVRLHGGAEYWIQPGFAMRVGYDDDRATGGFGYRFAPQYELDYGVSDHVLGMSHRVGLSYRFGGFFASSKASPEMFSPTGERAVTKLVLNARTKSDPESWNLAIVNKSDEVVRQFGGPGQPPSHLEWDGKDETGLPLPDGVYRYKLTVKDREGRQVLSPARRVEIQTEGPRVDVPVVPAQ